MTKYCVMRECEKSHSWISLTSGDLAFSQCMEFMVLNPSKGFWRSVTAKIEYCIKSILRTCLYIKSILHEIVTM